MQRLSKGRNTTRPVGGKAAWWQLWLLSWVSLCLAVSVVSTSAEDKGSRKKIIELGWDIPSTSFLRTNYQRMEQSTPFDGIMFKLDIPQAQRRLTSESIWDHQPWQREWLAPALEDLRACQFKQYTDNFLRFNATPGTLAWEDEAGWQALTDKAGACAWLVKNAGARGLAIDFESYGAHQFRYDATKGRSFAATVSFTRKRGAQFVQSIAREYPDAVLLCLWLNSINFSAGRGERPEVLLEAHEYGLLPAFINGMLDSLPPGMTLVDGCENGYYLDSAEEYLRTAHDIRSWTGAAMGLVAPENQARYRQQVQVGFGFYLDMFVNEEGNRYYRGPLEGSRMKRLQRNLSAALEAADQYVWVYGEQCRWWGAPLNLPKTVGKGRLWDEALPGLGRLIARTRDPVAAARSELTAKRQSGQVTNLAINPRFAEGPASGNAKMPVGFSAWQDEKNPTGRFDWDAQTGEGAGRATKVKWGCFLQKHAVQAGETYAVEVDCRAQGTSLPGLTVRWQKGDGQWTQWQLDRTFAFHENPGAWSHAFGVVTVPPETSCLVILLDIRNQLTERDVCWFDNLGLYCLEQWETIGH